MSNLAKQIDNLNSKMAKELPKEILEVFAQGITDFKATNLEAQAIQVGMPLPPFSLKNSLNQTVNSDDLRRQYDKVILFFFRGSWCPYCNLELRAIQDELISKQRRDIHILAISPQLPEHSKQLVEQYTLEFDLLADFDNRYAKKLGICLPIPEYSLSTYKNLGISLSDYNGTPHAEVPIPAVLVINKHGVITYSFIDSNYMNRIDIDLLLKQL